MVPWKYLLYRLDLKGVPMIESGSMLFNGRRCGSLSLIIAPGQNFAWAAQTPGKNTLEDAIFDAHYKLDECIASRSPVEAEIAFLAHWLQLAKAPPVTPGFASPEIPPVETPIQDDSEPPEDPYREVGMSTEPYFQTFTRK